METILSELINNPKVPKWIRCILVAVVCGFVIFLGVMLALKSQIPAGRIFGGALSVLFAAAAVWLFVKIAKGESRR